MELGAPRAESSEQTGQTPASTELARQRELQHAGQEFEAYMLNLMLSAMRKSVQSGGLFGEKSSEGYRLMLYDALTRKAAEAGTFGLAQQLIQQLESQQ